MHIVRVLEELMSAEGFARGAAVLVRALAEALTQAMHEGDWGDDATLLRGLVHLRPDWGGVGLCCVPLDEDAAPEGHMSSLNAWRRVRVGGRALWVAVREGLFCPLGGPEERLPAAADGLVGRTRVALDALDVTHLIALPLGARGRVRGMVTLELRCPTLGDEPFDPWLAQGRELEQLCALAGDHVAALPLSPSGGAPEHPLLCSSRSRETLNMLQHVVRLKHPILLLGESGTGKTQLARWIHERSGVKGPFVEAPLAGLSPDQITLKLFGSRRGAFTGAERLEGLVPQAQGGTLFIDELHRVPAGGQDQLLRLLDAGVYQVLGEPRPRQATLRLIAATNLRPEEAIQSGRLAEDLVYRMEGVEVAPLRQRSPEIVGFALRFLEEAELAPGLRLSTEAGLRLQGEPWPDNLRGLKRAVTLAGSIARERQAPDASPPPSGLEISLADVEAALSRGRAGGARGLEARVARLAEDVVATARRRHADGRPAPGLGLAEVLRGAVVAEALKQAEGDAARAARWLGLEHSIARSSNHLRKLRESLRQAREAAEVSGLDLRGLGLEPEVEVTPRAGR